MREAGGKDWGMDVLATVLLSQNTTTRATSERKHVKASSFRALASVMLEQRLGGRDS